MDSDPQKRIQDHYEDPYHRGRCNYATHHAELQSDCAEPASETQVDVIAVELHIASDSIREIWFDGDGCRFSQAFASMLAEYLEGKRTNEVQELSLDEVLQQINVKVESDRAACGRLALEAIQAAVRSQGLEREDGPTFGGPDLGDEC